MSTDGKPHIVAIGGGAFLPIHWGTFSLAMHAWDEPAETLFTHASRHGTALLMPRLGEAVEPVHLERVDPWWRGVDRISPEPRPREPVVERLPKSMPWPID